MKKQLVDDWVTTHKGGSVYTIDHNGNTYVDFGRLLNLPENYHEINTFILNRDSYKTRSRKINGYVNYFFNFHCSDNDNEFIEKLFMLKILVDDTKKRMKVKTFIKLIKEYLITDKIQDKIWEMVEDNYLYILDKKIEDDDNVNDKYHKHLIIRDANGKRIMCSVIAINLIYPLVTHYVYKRNKKDDNLFQYFSPFIDLFSTEEVDNLQKLSMFVWGIISSHVSQNKTMWRHRYIMGDEGSEGFYDICLRKHIVTDSLPWLIFDNNLGAFLQKVVQEQLRYYIRDEYDIMPIELETKKTVEDGFSEMEIYENRLYRMDESLIILSELNVKSVITGIKSKFNMYISEEEISFYEENLKITRDQRIMIDYHFAKYFNGYRDLNMISKRTFIELAIIMKLRLIGKGMVYLPYILTGNLKTKGVANKIHVDKILKHVTESKYYKTLMDEKFGFIIIDKKKNPIIKLLKSIISSKYAYVEYGNENINGKDIKVDLETLIYEFLQFIDQI